MDCMKFYHRYARDGRNYTARAVYPCYFDETATHFVVIDYDPEKVSGEQTLPFFFKKKVFCIVGAEAANDLTHKVGFFSKDPCVSSFVLFLFISI